MKILFLILIIAILVEAKPHGSSEDKQYHLNTLFLGPTVDSFDQPGNFWYQITGGPDSDLVDLEKICPINPPYSHLLSKQLQSIFTECGFHDFSTKREIAASESVKDRTIRFVTLLPHGMTLNLWLQPESFWIQNQTRIYLTPCMDGISCLPPADVKAIICLQTQTRVPLKNPDCFDAGALIVLSTFGGIILLPIACCALLLVCFYLWDEFKKIMPKMYEVIDVENKTGEISTNQPVTPREIV